MAFHVPPDLYKRVIVGDKTIALVWFYGKRMFSIHHTDPQFEGLLYSYEQYEKRNNNKEV